MVRDRVVVEDGRDRELEALRAGHRLLEERYRLLHDRISQGVLVHDREGRVTSWNAAAARIFGLQDAEISLLGAGRGADVSATGLEVIQEDGSELPMEEFPPTKALRTGRGEAGVFLGFRPRPAEPYRWIQMQAVPRRDDEGRVVEVVTLVDDLTELRLAHRAVRESEERLIAQEDLLHRELANAQKMEAVGMLARRFAHDFNNLMMTVAGYTQILLSEASSAGSMRDDLLEIDRAAQRATAIARRLLVFRPPPQRGAELVDLSRALVKIRPVLQRTIGDSIDLRVDAEPGTLVRVNMTQLTAALLNLALNSREAMPSGGTLAIRCRAHAPLETGSGGADEERPSDDHVVLEVMDTGMGMPPEVQSRIFEPFFTTKLQSDGSGLGLPAVDGVVRRTGGWIDVESELGRGTTVRIYLPLACPS
ncbi:MAG: ATP-binding protein [Gemmatimonadota bacterium]